MKRSLWRRAPKIDVSEITSQLTGAVLSYSVSILIFLSLTHRRALDIFHASVALGSLSLSLFPSSMTESQYRVSSVCLRGGTNTSRASEVFRFVAQY